MHVRKWRDKRAVREYAFFEARKKGGLGEEWTMIYLKTATPLGKMVLASDGTALAGAWFEGQKYFPSLEGWGNEEEDLLLRKAASELALYFDGRLKHFSLPMQPSGTAFQKKVWAGIAGVLYGGTLTYGFLAERLATSPRAVGSATGRNPLSIFIPCHRLVASDGFITGYAGGLERKRALLALEGIAVNDDRVTL